VLDAGLPDECSGLPLLAVRLPDEWSGEGIAGADGMVADTG
jgi:hypothetical protein